MTLPERHRLVLERRFCLSDRKPTTLEEIGKQLGVTKQRVCDMEASALTRLRRERAVWDLAARQIRSTLKAAGGVARFEGLLHAVDNGRSADASQMEFLLRLTLKLDREIVETRIDGMPIWGLRSSPMALVVRIQRLCRSALRKSRTGLGLDAVISRVLEELKSPSVSRAFVAAAIKGCKSVRVMEDFWLFDASSRVGPRLFKTVSILRKSGEPLHFRTITERLNWRMKQQSSPRAVQAFLERNTDMFVRTGKGMFGLREWRVEGSAGNDEDRPLTCIG